MANRASEPATPFERDLAALAREARSELGEPPTEAELRGLKAGNLEQAHADRIRNWLALDEDWAAAFRDLDSDPSESELASLAEEAARAGVDTDAAWARFADRAGETDGSSTEAADIDSESRIDSGRAVLLPFPGTDPVRALTLAALIVLSLGVILLLPRLSPMSPGGGIEPLRIELSASESRGDDDAEEVPSDTQQIRFVLHFDEPLEAESVRIAVINPITGATILVGEPQPHEAGSGSAELWASIEGTALEEGKDYRIEIRDARGDGDPLWSSRHFRIRFTDP